MADDDKHIFLSLVRENDTGGVLFYSAKTLCGEGFALIRRNLPMTHKIPGVNRRDNVESGNINCTACLIAWDFWAEKMAPSKDVSKGWHPVTCQICHGETMQQPDEGLCLNPWCLRLAMATVEPELLRLKEFMNPALRQNQIMDVLKKYCDTPEVKKRRDEEARRFLSYKVKSLTSTHNHEKAGFRSLFFAIDSNFPAFFKANSPLT